MRTPFSPAERRSVAGMAAVVGGLLVVGWGGLAAIVLAGRVHGGAGFGLGLGATVFALGVRHAFDADHIAAIDNATRTLTRAGHRPLSTGFWFSLGHSSVVFVACAALAAGVRALTVGLTGGAAGVRAALSTVGLWVSAGFLIVLGVVNLVALVGLVGLYGRGRAGLTAAEVDAQLDRRGFVTRLLGGRLGRIGAPWQLFPVGLLFGLGFDTATEVGLFAISGTAATLVLPWYAVLCLPVLFAGGMALFDTADGLLTSYTYAWSAGAARRRLAYNMVVTGLSVALALSIGVVEAAGLLGERLGVSGGVLGALGGVGLDRVGYAAAGAFVAAWALALVLGRRHQAASAIGGSFNRLLSES
ncbi:MAG: HoxN/HupN/NixA family nickel/cobalt transporter [Actinomycetia bacterium]|nr:HoxN/HupN/NixA family nickel/cobalt transporter [Actinomycetes bacterium]